MEGVLAFEAESAGALAARLRERRLEDDDRRVLRCAACAARVTGLEHRIERDGAHIHERSNPAGIVFRIGCFDAAPGCAATGEPTERWTWFRGFAWRIGVCRRCGVQLGWEFGSGGEGFFGLILDRLVLAP